MRLVLGHPVTEYNFNTVIVGSGAAGMNCARKLYEYACQSGISNPEERFAVVTAGIPLGASRMSGSDKQTYYKQGTSPDTPDSAARFAESLTAFGCCHRDLALAEGIGSLRAFYSLVEAGVPFPSDGMGSYVGYKTDHDPYQRATSAGPKTSKCMSECLQRIVGRYGIPIFNHQEALELLAAGEGDQRRIKGIVTVNRSDLPSDTLGINVFHCSNIVLAAGGPGALYKATVYPRGQTGMHGVAFAAGLSAENLTESQFGLASTKFRWNVSGTYMQAIPRVFSTDRDLGNAQECLTPFFPTTASMATNIFLKGYQWPFDPQRVAGHQSSLIDLIVHGESAKGRRVFLDFRSNPVGREDSDTFSLDQLGSEAREYLESVGALQPLPIGRLQHMNPLAIDIYAEHGIDIAEEPLEIAVCAQHNNGGFGVDRWWQSSIKRTFVIGEMAGTHGVKRPGGSALNAGQVGAQRAAEFIVNSLGCDVPPPDTVDPSLLEGVLERLDSLFSDSSQLSPAHALEEIADRMTGHAGHIRELDDASNALREAIDLHRRITSQGFQVEGPREVIEGIRARHLALSSVAYLKAIVELLRSGSGSRGSHLVLGGEGVEAHPTIKDPRTGKALMFLPENEELRESIMRVEMDTGSPDLFRTESIAVRDAPQNAKAFEVQWAEYRDGKTYEQGS